MQDREVKIKLSILNNIGNYLSRRPYIEVVELMDMLKAGITELPSQEEIDDETQKTQETPDALAANGSED